MVEIFFQYFFGRGFCWNLFGINFSSESFCYRVFKEILAKMFSIFFGRDSSFQSVGKECLFRDFWVDICFGYILVVISLQ